MDVFVKRKNLKKIFLNVTSYNFFQNFPFYEIKMPVSVEIDNNKSNNNNNNQCTYINQGCQGGSSCLPLPCGHFLCENCFDFLESISFDVDCAFCKGIIGFGGFGNVLQ